MPDSQPASRPPSAVVAGAQIYVPAAPVIQADRILRIQGYPDLERIRPAIRRSAESMAALAPRLSSPRVGYRRLPIVGIRDDALEVPGAIRFHCDAFARVLAGCTEVAAFALTVGPRLDARVVELTEAGELLDALLLETAGWLCIEDATRQFKVHLREWANARGCRITSRMGPGYSYKLDGRMSPPGRPKGECPKGEYRSAKREGPPMCVWPLEEQIALFRLFEGADLPVTVMASCAMQPKMSRSGLFGIAPLAVPVPTGHVNTTTLCAMPET